MRELARAGMRNPATIALQASHHVTRVEEDGALRLLLLLSA